MNAVVLRDCRSTTYTQHKMEFHTSARRASLSAVSESKRRAIGTLLADRRWPQRCPVKIQGALRDATRDFNDLLRGNAYRTVERNASTC